MIKDRENSIKILCPLCKSEFPKDLFWRLMQRDLTLHSFPSGICVRPSWNQYNLINVNIRHLALKTQTGWDDGWIQQTLDFAYEWFLFASMSFSSVPCLEIRICVIYIIMETLDWDCILSGLKSYFHHMVPACLWFFQCTCTIVPTDDRWSSQ